MKATTIYNLTDVIETPKTVNEEVVLAMIQEEVRNIVRERLPEIATRVVREEIEKIKKGE